MARERGSLSLKPHPSKRLKFDERGRCLLETGFEARPAAALLERCKFLEWVVGVRVSESTVLRLIGRLGWTRKEGL